MVKWELLPATHNRAKWDDALLQSQDYTVFQSFRWGEFKRGTGWTPMRWIARDRAGLVVAMAQILTKSFRGRVKIGWAPGGPVLLFPPTPLGELALIVKLLLQEINALGGRTCIRFDSYLAKDTTLSSAAFEQSCARPLFAMNTGCSSCLDLRQPMDVLTRKMTSKHRYYVKKALTENLQWNPGSDTRCVEELARLHTEMVLQKKLPSLRSCSREISAMWNVLGTNATIFTGYVENRAVTSCMILTFGEKAFYLMAATSTEGRKLSASYAMIYRLLEYLQKQDITQFDLGGLNPGSYGAQGVNHFKRGFGGKFVERLGEWEWASSKWLRWALNLAVWYRGRQL